MACGAFRDAARPGAGGDAAPVDRYDDGCRRCRGGRFAPRREGSDFAKATLQAMREKSPTSLNSRSGCCGWREFKLLEECLSREYTAALKIFTSHDFPEGIRAVVVDKDRMPKWSPARIEDVTKDMIDAYFIAKEGEELTIGRKPAAPAPVVNALPVATPAA
ncbi:MAG: enoyl-CoA hydratase/isomerase family protein [Nibricoccus sp.]